MNGLARCRPLARFPLAALLLTLVATHATPSAALAWSAPGHRIVGLGAERLLTGDTRRALREIAGDQGLDEIGLYLDQERERLNAEVPNSTKWHYDNRPVCDASVPRSVYCPDGHCASGQYDRWHAVLADRNAPREQRLFALRVVVHVLGDVHQPLHSGDNRDRGGNDVNVGWGGRDEIRNLHRLWDRELVDAAMRGDSERRFANRLVSERRREVKKLQSGHFAAWQQESYEHARDFVYGRLPEFACGRPMPFVTRLPPEYREESAAIIRERLARAAIRLAGELNRALDR